MNGQFSVLFKLTVVSFLGVSGILAAKAPIAPQMDNWMPVDEETWAVFMEAPKMHLLKAQEDLSKPNKDTKAAANEIRRANSFLRLQAERINSASKQLNGLAKDIASGKVVSPKEVEETFMRAMSVIDYRQPMIPIMSGSDTIFTDETDFHFNQAKSNFLNKDYKAAGNDLRKASAYLKLKAAHAGEKIKSALSSSATELEDMAKKVEQGTVKGTEDMENSIDRAKKAIRGAL